MSVEGRLRIELFPAATSNGRVAIRSSRPLRAVQVFCGKTPQEVLVQLPLLFSVCRIAQATASAQAVGRALELPADAAIDAARGLLIQMETAREHLWRILVDWPEQLGEPPDLGLVPSLQAMLPALREALFVNGEAFSLKAQLDIDPDAVHRQIERLDEVLEAAVFRCPASEWLRISSRKELDAWLDACDSTAARFLQHVTTDGWQKLGVADSDFVPDWSQADLNQRLAAADADRFVGAPTWRGKTRETTSLARQQDCALIVSLTKAYGNGLLTRLAARLVEVARLPAAMRTLAARLVSDPPAPMAARLPTGVGIGQVEAARGRLVHRIVLDDGVVGGYRILAPTEWNFHPDGVVVRALQGLDATTEGTLRRQAAMLVNAVDPCVGYDLEVH